MTSGVRGKSSVLPRCISSALPCSQKPSVAAFSILELRKSSVQKEQMPARPVEEDWVKDLQIFKKQSPEEKALWNEILKNSEISTKNLLQKLDHVEVISDEVTSLKKSLEEMYDKFKWALETEKQQIQASSEPTHPQTGEVMDS